jgi:cellulose synthase/poly-beta-1,6-N-acetylglucosamine synthase-like glycosyltransferase
MTLVLSILGVILALLYGVLIFVVSSYWNVSTEIKTKGSTPSTFVSVIIAARNESAHISKLLDSLLASSYDLSKIEILVIDDFSMDNTADLVRNYSVDNVTLLSLSDATDTGSKKQAIAYATSLAKGDIWMFTDADCTVPKDWIYRTVHRFHRESRLKVLLGAVTYPTVSGFIKIWQQLDLMGMLAVTKAGVDRQQWFIGNGANLSIKSELWKSIGYSLDQKHKYASGDDVTLVQAAAKIDPASIGYDLHTGSLVSTQPQPTFAELLQQRLRWTSKNATQSGTGQKIVMGFTFVFSLYFLMLLVGSMMNHELWIAWLIVLVLKAILDTIFLTRIQRLYPSKIKTWQMLILSPLHTIYIAIFGLLALFPQKYSWKGRKVS